MMALALPIGEGASADHLIDTRPLGRILDGLRDSAGILSQCLQPDAEIGLAVERDVRGVKCLYARRHFRLEHQRLGNFRRLRRACRVQLEFMLQLNGGRKIGANLDPRQHAGIFHRQIDSRRSCGSSDIRAPEAYGELAERPLREEALVDICDRLAPAVQEVDRIVAAFDLRHANHRTAILIGRDPGFGVDDVKIRIRPVHFARLAMH